MKFRVFILLLLPVFSGCTNKMNTDMIIKNAKIYSVNDSFGIYESMAIRDGKITEIGNNSDIEGKYTADEIIDLDGKPVYPGFIDPHCHFYGYGTLLREANLRGTSSFDEILEILEQHSREYKEGWITGMGWDQNDWEIKEFPDNIRLDSLFPDRPVLIRRIDGHAAIANSVAMDLAGVNAETLVEGGDVLRKNGKATGVLIDNAINLVERKIPKPGEKQISEALLSAQGNCFAVGLTSVHDAGLETPIIKAIDQLHSTGGLKMKIYAMLSPTEANFKEYMYKGIYRTDYLHVASVKLYADGALGSRGAYLLEPYSDDPDNKGLLISSPDYLKEIMDLADSYGYQVNTHCIGDGANQLVLKMYGDILQDKNDKRWRIEHSQVVHPDDFKLFGKYSVIPSIQSTHATSDMYWAEERLGDRIKNAYAFQSLLKENGWLPNGSDFPVEDINPLFGFYAAVARKDHQGFPPGGFQISEALTREQALKAMTIWAAKSAFEEKEKGSLEPGKWADFVVLEKDIMEIPEEEIFNVKVHQTYVNGENVFEYK